MTFTKRSAAKDAAIKVSEQLNICNRVNVKNEMKQWVKILDQKALEKKYKHKAKTFEHQELKIKNIELIDENTNKTSELQELKIKNIALINVNTEQQNKIEVLEKEIRLCQRMIMLKPQIKTDKLKITNKRSRELNEDIASVARKIELCKKRNRADKLHLERHTNDMHTTHRSCSQCPF